MTRTELRHVDLGLLVIFEALMADPNATRVAEKLYMTQPAVSYALGRLRRLFHDPLFVREGRHLQPTDRAGQLLGEVRTAMDLIAGVVGQSRGFDPFTAQHTFRIGMPEDVELGLFPGVLQGLRDQAPHCRLVASRLDPNLAATQLAHGELALAIDYRTRLPDSVRVRPLRSVQLWVVRGDARPGGLTLEAFCTRPHVDLAGCSPLIAALDQTLAERGLGRNVQMRGAQFGYLAPLVRGSEWLALVPDFAVAGLVKVMGVRGEPAPLAVPAVELALAWSRARESIAAEQWLRQATFDGAVQRPLSRVSDARHRQDG